MRRYLLMAMLVLTGALPATADAAAGRSIAGTLSGQVTASDGWCCGSIRQVDGSTVVRGLGAVDFSLEYTAGDVCPLDPDGPCRIRDVSVQLTTASGDSLLLQGRSEWSGGDAPPTEWTVAGGTGRFRGYSGSGVFELLSDEGTRLTFSMSGTLAPPG